MADSEQDDFTRDRQRYWDEFAGAADHWEKYRRYYQKRLAEIYRSLIAPGMRVLELGCGPGNLLAALAPSAGVGLDLSPKMLERAKRRYPALIFRQGDALHVDLDETFDYVVCSDLVNDVADVQRLFERVARHCHSSTRLVMNSYNRMWEQPRHIAELLGLARKQMPQNWLTGKDVENLLYISGFEVIRTLPEILWPLRTPILGSAMNRYAARLWPFHYFTLTNFIIARPQPWPRTGAEPLVTVAVPARNEEGNIAQIFERIPQMGAGTELIFVEGGSRDDTYGAIEREMARRPALNVKLLRQTATGKGDAVRTAFRAASGEVLMVLDADLSVRPEDLPRFYEAWRSGKAELANGVRLVYPMEQHAMRFFNHIGNRFFSLVFSWLLGQSIKDTLCGTKAIGKRNYEIIARNRAYFGDLDPFGDFDLIFASVRQ